ncbi:MAG TPA: response regulator [Caulobacteraceae bacterium]|nr:response regulator [Caulobacteraceae bacterium]
MKDSAERALGVINLDNASILLIDDAWGIEILTRIFVGFGARHLHKAESLEAASETVAKLPVDLIVTETQLQGGDVYGFIRKLRADAGNERNRFAPVILLSAHAAPGAIAEARDCGANFFVAKPLSPKVMMDRVLWVAGAKRQYVETATYAGPDRRFRTVTLPPGVLGRRGGDPRPGVEAVELTG